MLNAAFPRPFECRLAFSNGTLRKPLFPDDLSARGAQLHDRRYRDR